jgi:hypothetical protein
MKRRFFLLMQLKKGKSKVKKDKKVKNETEATNKTVVENIRLNYTINWLTIKPLSDDVKKSIKKRFTLFV